MKKQWTTVLLILLALIVVLFAVLNVDSVIINFGFTMVEMPLAVILIVTLLIGVLMAVLLSTGIILTNKREQKRLNNQILLIEEENDHKKERLVQKYESENKSLRDEKEETEKEVRQLRRRIKNMDASNKARNNEENDLN